MTGPENKVTKGDSMEKRERQMRLQKRKAAFEQRQFTNQKEREDAQQALRQEEADIDAMDLDDASTGAISIKEERDDVQKPLKSIPAAKHAANTDVCKLLDL